MTPSFICHRHRTWLLQHPKMAQSIWFNNHEQACQLAEEKNFARAMSFAGCAVDAADIALQADPLPSRELLEHYTHTCALLMQLLERTRSTPSHSRPTPAARTLH